MGNRPGHPPGGWLSDFYDTLNKINLNQGFSDGVARHTQQGSTKSFSATRPVSQGVKPLPPRPNFSSKPGHRHVWSPYGCGKPSRCRMRHERPGPCGLPTAAHRGAMRPGEREAGGATGQREEAGKKIRRRCRIAGTGHWAVAHGPIASADHGAELQRERKLPSKQTFDQSTKAWVKRRHRVCIARKCARKSKERPARPALGLSGSDDINTFYRIPLPHVVYRSGCKSNDYQSIG